MTLTEAAHEFFAQPYTFTPLGGSSGYSGSAFARVTAEGREWCLRRWPTAFDVERLRAIHRVLRHSRRRGFVGVPDLATARNGDTAIKLNGEVYDAQSWMRGASLCGPARWAGTAPNTAERLTEPPLRSLALALAQFHRSTADLRPAIEDTYSPLVQRLTDADRSLGIGAKFLTTAVEQGQYCGDRTLALRWLETLPRAIFLARAILDRHPESANAVSTVCHGDLWTAHIYADECGFSGFIDFESLTWSSPTVDVAQLLVHCSDWRQRDAVVQAYSSVLPLTTDGWNVLPAAVIADVAGEGLWAMSALATGLPSHRIAHSNNLTALFQSLSLVVEEVEAHL